MGLCLFIGITGKSSYQFPLHLYNLTVIHTHTHTVKCTHTHILLVLGFHSQLSVVILLSLSAPV